MFIAESEKHQLINLVGITQSELKKLAESRYYCCDCGEEVILKKGSCKRAHFAHQKNSQCHYFSEGETNEHLAGKALVMENAHQFKLKAELEAYLPQLKQRPDCLLEMTHAIEFQCSPLSYKKLWKRTSCYRRKGYQVHWLLGEALYPKLSQRYLTRLQRQFIEFSPRLGYYLWGLSVRKKQLVLCYGIEQKKAHWSGHFHYLSLEKWNLLNAFQEGTNFTETWRERQPLLAQTKLNRQYWNSVNYRAPSSLFQLQQFLYQKGLNLRQLPLIYQVPSLTDILLGEKEVVIRILLFEKLQSSGYLSLLELATIDQESEIQKILNSCSSLVSHKKIIALSCYRFLTFLEQVHLVRRENDDYIYQAPRLPVESYLKGKLENKVELVRIPLEYDMIKQ